MGCEKANAGKGMVQGGLWSMTSSSNHIERSETGRKGLPAQEKNFEEIGPFVKMSGRRWSSNSCLKTKE